MITNNRDNDADDDLAGLADALQRLARRLDAEHYPGRAWPVSSARRRRPFAWPLAAPLAAVAAVAVAAVIGAILVYHGRAPQSPTARAPGGGEMVRQSPRPLKSPVPDEKATSRTAIPSVVVVEDAESYSFIDTTAGSPVVSFTTKDSYSPLCVVPVLPESASQAAGAETSDEYHEPPVVEGRDGGIKLGPQGDAR
jgi:hypothetical protein